MAGSRRGSERRKPPGCSRARATSPLERWRLDYCPAQIPTSCASRQRGRPDTRAHPYAWRVAHDSAVASGRLAVVLQPAPLLRSCDPVRRALVTGASGASARHALRAAVGGPRLAHAGSRLAAAESVPPDPIRRGGRGDAFESPMRRGRGACEALAAQAPCSRLPHAGVIDSAFTALKGEQGIAFSRSRPTVFQLGQRSRCDDRSRGVASSASLRSRRLRQPRPGHYAAANAALHGATRALAIELRAASHRQCVAPGISYRMAEGLIRSVEKLCR